MSSNVDPLRSTGPVFGRRRQLLNAECDQLQAEVNELDRQLDSLSARRQQAMRDLRERRRRLWPSLGKRARRPTSEGRRALPPIAAKAVALWGRRLRSVCRDILRTRGGSFTLTELHAMLHRRGYFVQSGDGVKVLADSLRYEVLQSRMERVARGEYTLV